MSSLDAFGALFDELVERLAVRLVERLRTGEPGMIAQSNSPLGARRHCATVKRRLAQGEPGAAIVGRRHLLSPEALAQELERTSSRSEAGAERQPGSVRAELLAELQVVKAGGRRG